MGRFAGFLNKALPGIGAAMDYAGGKAEGEDNIRAIAGAAGSGLGGWGGAVQGGTAGAVIGTMIAPGIGTAIGGAIGGISGGIAGSFAGGWTADRLDETVRGKNTGVKNNMSNVVQLDNGDIAEVDDNGNLIGWLVKGGAVVAGGNALYGAGRNVVQNVRPMQTYQGYQQLNNAINPVGIGRVNNMAAAQSAAGTVARQVGSEALQGAANSRAGQFLGAMPGWAKVAGGVLLADQATGGNLTNAIGRGIAGGADMIANAMGFKTDFDGRNQMSQQAMKEDRESQRVEQNRGIYNPYDDALDQKALRNLQLAEDYDNRRFARDQQANREWADKADEVSRRNFLTSFAAGQANELLRGYMNDIPNSVSNSIRNVISARYN